MNRAECVHEALRHALEVLAVAAPDWLLGQALSHRADAYTRRAFDDRLPRSAAKRAAWVQQVGEDGHHLLAALDTAEAPKWLRRLPVLEMLRRIWVQQFTLCDGKVAWRTEREGIPPAARFISSPSRWVENPYFQHFTGEVFFQHRQPIHPSSLSRWRVRIGEEGVEWLLTKTIEAGRASGAVTPRSLSEIAVDTTVMEKAIAYPTDSRLYERARRSLVVLAGKAGITLRQNYNRKAPRLAAQAGRHAHARQFRRMRKVLRTLKGYTGRVLRDIGRKLGAVPEGPLRARIEQRLALVTRLLRQTPKSPRKLYALHEPEVDCISKGKARVRYEFGCKVSIATTLTGGFVVGMRSMPGNPYDGHTLVDALQQVEILTDQRPSLAVVDRGYRGHRVQGIRVLVSGTRRGLTHKLAKLLRRRSAIEPEIGHMKSDGRLARCALKGTIGDALFAVLCGCGHNIRKILAHLRALLLALITSLIQAVGQPDQQPVTVQTA